MLCRRKIVRMLLSALRFVVKHKFIFIFLLSVWIIGVMTTVALMAKNGDSKLPLQKVPLHALLRKNHLPPADSFKMTKVLRYCNPPAAITVGQEGISRENYTLEQVIIIIRHGDRSPFRQIRGQASVDCSAGMMNSDYLLSKYLSTLKAIHRPSKMKDPFISFPLYPALKRCSSSQLTMLGVLQHLTLGRRLGKLYNTYWKLLPNNWTMDDLSIHSTRYSRTYQSGIAFLFGFLPKFNFQQLKFLRTLDATFCSEDHKCQCPLIDRIQRHLDKKQHKLLDSHPAVVHLIGQLNPIVKAHVNDSDISLPFSMFDSLMGYVCHGSHLPCLPDSDNCVTIDHIRNLIAFLEWQGRQLVEDGNFIRVSVLKTYGLMRKILNNMLDYISGKTTHRVVLYSAHDITLSPLAAALGFSDGLIPPFAGRIIFELYNNKKNGNDRIIRILQDGKDVTKYVNFCKPSIPDDGFSGNNIVCNLSSFVKYIRTDIFKKWNASSYSNMCNARFTEQESVTDM